MTEEEPRYNPIFARFVSEERDGNQQLQGLIAYGLYKVAKREWASDFWRRQQRKPTPQELDEYTKTWTESRLKGLEEQAQTVLLQYAETVVDAATSSIREDALRGTATKSVFLSMLANAIYTIALILALILLRYAGVDLLSILTSVGTGKP